MLACMARTLVLLDYGAAFRGKRPNNNLLEAFRPTIRFLADIAPVHENRVGKQHALADG
jgi:hypothetical protein